MPKISIIIATRNRNGLLKKTLVSLSTQTFKNSFEVLVCDDGGNSDTRDLVNKFNAKLDIHYYWLPDSGGYCWAQVKNYGAKKAKASYLLFMDDDILIPNYGIKKMYRWITKLPWRKNKYFVTPASRLYVYNNFSHKLITSNYKKIAKYNIDNLKSKVNIGCTGIIHKNIFEKIGGFDKILFCGLQLGDTDITKRLEGFLGVTRKIFPMQVYHLDNDPFRDNRNIIAIQRKNIAKQLIQEKLQMMHFRFKNLDDIPKKNETRERKGYYDELLKDSKKLKNFSIILRKRMLLYDNSNNYYKPNIRK